MSNAMYTGFLTFDNFENACKVQVYKFIDNGKIEIEILDNRKETLGIDVLFKSVATKDRHGTYSTPVVKLTTWYKADLREFDEPSAKIAFKVTQADSEKIMIEGVWTETDEGDYEFTGRLTPDQTSA